VLNIKIIDVLREKLTLIYGGGMRGGLGRDPYPHYHAGPVLALRTRECGPGGGGGVGRDPEDPRSQGLETSADLAKVKQNWLTTHRRKPARKRLLAGQAADC
jgi:zinc protease